MSAYNWALCDLLCRRDFVWPRSLAQTVSSRTRPPNGWRWSLVATGDFIMRGPTDDLVMYKDNYDAALMSLRNKKDIKKYETYTSAKPSKSAADILTAAADHMAERATQRDTPGGERTMCRTVAAFNAMYGTNLTEVQGWQFMVLLKMSRASAGAHVADDYEDQTAYSALAGECANRED
uniref:Gp27 n=1 Tax=Edwardsiella phage eiAU TaxID=945083 RepID=E7EKT8_9CAUD|nr:gp27 [Edwardsiella phage eiAU]